MHSKGISALVAVCALGLFVSTAHAADPPLLTSMKTARGNLSLDASYQALSRAPGTASVELVQADAAQIDLNAQTLQLDVGGRALRAQQQYAFRNANGMLVWYGLLTPDSGLVSRLAKHGGREISDDPKNSVMIVRNGDKLTGTIRDNGQLYSLRPLRSGGHALSRIDETRMPPDHPREYASLPLIAMPSQKTAASGSTVGIAAVSTIRVMVVMTQSAINASGDASGLVNLAVAETNQGYANSGVEINLQLAGWYSTTYVESGSFSTDLTRFRGTSDGHMDSIHATRNSISADVAMLLINNSSSCGLASGIGSTATTAFAVTHYSCATGYYSFGHELGHLQSARHDPATDSSNSPYAYGHGYRYDAGGWRTIMSYACPGGCTRLNYWSNPAKTYGGVPMGTTTRSHNQRVLNNTKGTIAGFR